MVKREEVEFILAACEPGSDSFLVALDSMTRRKMRELARTWLRVNDALEVTVPKLQVHTGLSQERWKPHAIELPRELAGQRVKLVLVPEADSGGDRGLA